MRIVHRITVTVAAAAAVVAAARGLAADAAASAPPPADASRTLAVADGLEATLFASEPLLSSPADIDVDARGRIWVCEVVNYRSQRNTRPEGDRILVLEDTDGDGRADRQTVFHQGRDVDSALGICVIGEGPGRKVIVSCSPDVFVFHDDDGDLRADRRETLFTKTGEPQHDHSAHAFVVGPDGRWYFNFGNTGKAVHDRDGKPVTDLFGNVVRDGGKPWRQGMVFRCRPDGGDFEVLGHNFRNNYEVAVDSFGSLWQSDNDDDGNASVRVNFVMEYGNYGYVDERSGAGWRAQRTNREPETPRQHWHQNDPGVVPNLLLTGAGSPAGICVAEGALLPERFRGAVLHCDAGPNLVRAYRVTPRGAGFAAEAEVIVDGSADQWFRPSDVCLAPDGSAIIADWYDPGVGGHGMGDTQKGRIYRLASAGSRWSVPAVDLETVAGAAAALASPNMSTRATALERLAREPSAAAPALAAAYESASDPRLKARFAWAAGMLPGQADGWIERLSADACDDLRVVALRLGRRANRDVPALVERFLDDPSPAVRREAAIALKGVSGPRADRAWAALASRHAAGDRWELEALGIGADGPAGLAGPNQWDGRLAAWLDRIAGRWRTEAGREIVWRSRAAATPALACEVIGDPGTQTGEALAFVRALDFQDSTAVQKALGPLVASYAAPEETRRAVLPELVIRLDPAPAQADPRLAARIDEAATCAADSQRFLQIVDRFRLVDRIAEVVRLATAADTAEQTAAMAVAVALDAGGADAIKAALARGDDATIRLLGALGIRGSAESRALVAAVLADDTARPEVLAAAVRALARSHSGARDLVTLAAAGDLAGSLLPVAGMAIALAPYADVRQSAAGVLPLPQTRGGEPLPPVAELLRRTGDAAKGRDVFAGAGTCAKCHVVGDAGRAVGPALSGIGAKLSRPALYEAILAPSAAISHSFETWTAVLDDGRSATGLLVSQSSDQVVLRGADGIDVTLPAGEIETLVRQPVSLMPADLAAGLSPQDLVDLVAWLETLRATN